MPTTLRPWQKSHLLSIVILAAGTVSAIAGGVHLHAREIENANVIFAGHIRHIESSILKRIEQAEYHAQSTAALLESTPQTGEKKYKKFIHKRVQENREIIRIDYAQYTKNNGRDLVIQYSWTRNGIGRQGLNILKHPALGSIAEPAPDKGMPAAGVIYQNPLTPERKSTLVIIQQIPAISSQKKTSSTDIYSSTSGAILVTLDPELLISEAIADSGHIDTTINVSDNNHGIFPESIFSNAATTRQPDDNRIQSGSRIRKSGLDWKVDYTAGATFMASTLLWRWKVYALFLFLAGALIAASTSLNVIHTRRNRELTRQLLDGRHEPENRASQLNASRDRLQQEIVRRMQTEKELEKHKFRLNMMIETSSESIMLIDPKNGNILEADRNACQLLEIEPEPDNTVSLYVLSPSSQPDGSRSETRLKALFDKALNNKNTLFEWELISYKHKHRILCDTRFSPITSQSETLIRVSIMDKTWKHQTGPTLNKLSRAIDQTEDSIIITDYRGIIEYVNRAFELSTGYSKNEVTGKSPGILKSGQHEDIFYSGLWKTITSGKTYRNTFINRRKDGSLLYEEKTISPIRNSHRGKLPTLFLPPGT